MRALLVAFALSFLAACSFNYGGDTSGSAARSDKVESDATACVNACNNAFARCMDTSAAHRNMEDSPQTWGAQASCDSQLRNCLPTCKGR